MEENKWSADNVAFGSGGGLLQKLDRDTCKFAFKCSAITVDGKDIDVFKEPITAKFKKSKPGRMKLIKDLDNYKTINIKDEGKDLLQEVFRDGELIKEYTFKEIRSVVEDK